MYSPRDLAARIQGLAASMPFDKALAVVKQEVATEWDHWWPGIADFVIRACDRQFRTDARRLPVAAGTPWTERYFQGVTHPIGNTGVRKAYMDFGRKDGLVHARFLIEMGTTTLDRGKTWERIFKRVPDGKTLGDVFNALSKQDKDFLAREAGLRRERAEEAVA